MRIVLVGGGSGGHFYPLIGISESLITHSAASSQPLELFYMGPDPYDKPALDALGISFVRCTSGKQRKYRSILNFFDIFKVLWGIKVAFFKLFFLYPDAIMSKGGYTSVPIVIAAWILRIPIVIHESDSVVGKANKLGARFAKYIAISYADAAKFFKAEKTALTGIPVRRVLTTVTSDDPLPKLGINETLPLILVLGGSQGAERVNDLILESLDELLPSYNILHQTGASNFETVKTTAESVITDSVLVSRYHPVPFLGAEALALAYQAASIVISRGGSGSIFEIASHGKPSIIIPIPEDVSHDQRTNAYAYARSGAATVMEEGNLRDGLLVAEISRIMSSPEIYNTMSTAAHEFAPADAGEKIAQILEQIASTHR